MIWAATLVACANPSPLPPLALSQAPEIAQDESFVVLGDTQRTTWVETLFLRREQNEEARRALIQKLASEERPAFVVHLGDMVNAGFSSEEWDYFDHLVSPLTARGVRILPVLGNHDYWGTDAVALRHARQRFPELAPRTYRSLIHRGLALLFLDSNLEGGAAQEQTHWFEVTLEALERNAEVRGALVFTHHPPFTNGLHRTDDVYVSEQLLPPFFRARKTLALLSGHVHGYERFEVRGKAFVVSAGGGGPRVTYATGSDARHVPAYVTPDGSPRAFHYLVVADEGERLRFTVKCLERGELCDHGQLETFWVPIPTWVSPQ